MIFIDGLHHYDQVLKDIDNSLNHLSQNGSILCHDCLPTTEKMQSRDDNGGEWTGDVWKAMFIIMRDRTDINLKVINTDYGCGLIRREPQENVSFHESLTYNFYDKNKSRILNIISPKEFEEWISGR